MLRRLSFIALSLALAQLACSNSSSFSSSKGNDGMLRLVLASVPTDVRCLVLTVVGSGGTSVRTFDVTPNTSASLSGTGLPVGTVAVSEAAFAVACSSVTSSTVPTWVSNGAVTIQLVAGQPTTVTIEMVRPGQITVTNVFNDGTSDAGIVDSGLSVDLPPTPIDSGLKLDVPRVVDSSAKLDLPVTPIDGAVKLDVPATPIDGAVKLDVPATPVDSAVKLDVPATPIDSAVKLDVPRVVDSAVRLDVPRVVDSSAKLDVGLGVPGCTNPITFSGGQTGSFNTTGAVCYRTTDAIAGWGCSNFDGRTLAVDNVPTTCGATLPARWNDGYYYFVASAGSYPYASIYTW